MPVFQDFKVAKRDRDFENWCLKIDTSLEIEPYEIECFCGCKILNLPKSNLKFRFNFAQFQPNFA